MKKLLIIVIAALLAAASCDENGDPEGPTQLPSEYNGTFDVDFQLDHSNCAFPPPLDGFEDITVRDDSFEWGSVSGTWDEDEKRGFGTGAETCIPITPPVGCIGCYVVEFDITFASPDSFYGQINVPYDYTLECQASSCVSIYDVTGVRAE
jgi:hypothetical protein